jgi:hydrogenase maturation protease
LNEYPSILIACIGNIFLGDDGFGCETARALRSRRSLPENVRLVDFGIRGFDLGYALVDGYDVAIFVDAAPRGQAPGTVYLIEPDLSELKNIPEQAGMIEPHGMDPMKVLTMAKSMGAKFGKIYLVGCEPEFTGEEDEGYMGLSEPVQAAIAEAVKMIENLVAEINAQNARIAAV